MILENPVQVFYQAVGKTAHAVVSKSVVRAQNESRGFRALLPPPGQCPAQVLLQWEHGAFKAPESPLWLRPRGPCPGRAGCGAAACCRFAQGGCARAEAEARNSESGHEVVRRLLMAARVTCRYLVTPELILETPLILLYFSFLNLAFD